MSQKLTPQGSNSNNQIEAKPPSSKNSQRSRQLSQSSQQQQQKVQKSQDEKSQKSIQQEQPLSNEESQKNLDQQDQGQQAVQISNQNLAQTISQKLGSGLNKQQLSQLNTKNIGSKLSSLQAQDNDFDIFVTQFQTTPGLEISTKYVMKIQENYSKINSIIDTLDSKVDGVIERHEAEFLMAYRTHMSKIKKELAEMKKKTDEQEANFSNNDRVSGLEKQLHWFREESLKLYGKLEQKNKETDDLKLKLQEADKEKQFLEGQVKSLLKKTKYLEVKLVNVQGIQYDQQQQYSFDEMQPQKSFQHQNTLQNNTNGNINDTLYDEQIMAQISNKSNHGGVVVEIIKRNETNLSQVAYEISNYIQKLDDSKTKQIKLVQEKFQKLLKEKLKMNVVRSDLENFFLECVETVRRQIIRRKYMSKDPQNINYYLNEIKDYSIFRLEDKTKILELLLSHEKLLIYLYQKIFPQQFDLHLQYAIDKNQKEQFSQQNNNQNSILPNIDDQNHENLNQTYDYQNNDQNIMLNQQKHSKNMSFDYNQDSKQKINASFEQPSKKNSKTINNQQASKTTDKVMVKNGKLVFRNNN